MRRSALQYARRMFDRAIEIDPNFARAHAGIADCCSFLYMYWDSSKANLEAADASSRRALAVDPASAEAAAMPVASTSTAIIPAKHFLVLKLRISSAPFSYC